MDVVVTDRRSHPRKISGKILLIFTTRDPRQLSADRPNQEFRLFVLLAAGKEETLSYKLWACLGLELKILHVPSKLRCTRSTAQRSVWRIGLARPFLRWRTPSTPSLQKLNKYLGFVCSKEVMRNLNCRFQCDRFGFDPFSVSSPLLDAVRP